jgi:hypothetical protein
LCSRRGSVFVDESAEEVVTLDRVRERPAALVAPVGWAERECSVRPLSVVMGHVATEYAFEMAAAEEQDPVETLATDRAHEPLRVGVRLWRPNRRLDYGDPFASEHFVKGGAEFAVSVVDQEPRSVEDTGEAEVARLLGDPAPVGLVVQPASCTRRLPSSMKKST